MTTNINQNQKRIITNEDLHDMIVDSFDRFFTVIDENTKEIKSEFNQKLSDVKTELKQDISDLRTELKGDINDLRVELKQDISDLRTELKGDINDLRSELKSDIFDLKNDMNQRFVIVDKQFMVIGDRLSGIENNMVYKHQIFPKFA